MKPNSISVHVNYINGSDQTVFNQVNPKYAIDEMFFPDSGMPCTVSITGTDANGKTVTISLSTQGIVNVQI